VSEGTFRQDLFYRVNVINLHLPSLRDRKEDIPDLVNFFIRKHTPEGDKPKKVQKGWSRSLKVTVGRATSANWKTPLSGLSFWKMEMS